MKKKVILASMILAILLFIISGCNSADYKDDLPPEPSPPVSEPTAAPSGNLAGKASYPFERGYAPAFDVYEEDAAKARLLFVDRPDIDLLGFEENTFTFPVRVEHPSGLVYKKGFIYTKAGWVPFEFPQKTLRNSNWILTKGETTLTLNVDDFPNEVNWVVAYSCKKQAGKWRCGMQQKDGAGGVWMLQSFTLRNAGIPAEPSAPVAPVVPAMCGNDIKEEAEVCDGVDLAGQTCQLQVSGSNGGTLSCNSDCTGFVTTACTMPVVVATGTVVCEVPLMDYGRDPAAKTAFTSTVTSATAKSKCEAYQIFGTDAKDVFAADATKLTGEVFTKPNPLNSAEQHEWLRCTLSCVPQYAQATKCKDISGKILVNGAYQEPTDTTINSAEAKAQLYTIAKKSSTAC